MTQSVRMSAEISGIPLKTSTTFLGVELLIFYRKLLQRKEGRWRYGCCRISRREQVSLNYLTFGVRERVHCTYKYYEDNGTENKIKF